MHTNLQALGAAALLCACTHQMRVTPTFSPDLAAAQRRGVICPRGEVISVAAVNQASDPASAGTTKAGVHTFNYRFQSDPALAVKAGIEDALRRGGCRLGPPGATNLQAAIKEIEARGLECGFASCEGQASSLIEARLLDSAGHVIFQDSFTSNSSPSCGLGICNEREASDMTNQVLSASISRLADSFATVIRKQAFTQPSTPGSQPGAPQAQAGEQPGE